MPAQVPYRVSSPLRPAVMLAGATAFALLVATVLPTRAAVAATGPAATGPAEARTRVSITFDDSNDSQVLAERSLARNGLAGTFYTMTGWVGTPGFLTRSDLSRFASDGMEIGAHTMTHPDLNEVSDEEVRRQLCGNRETLAEWGFRPTNLAYPMGRVNDRVESIAEQCGYVTARGGQAFALPGTCPSCQHGEDVASMDRYSVRALQSVGSTWTLDMLKKAVTEAAEGDGGWVILTFHQICRNYGAPECPASQSFDPAVFDAFARWLADYTKDASHSTSVGTVDEVLRASLGNDYPGYTRPAVETDDEPPAGTNLVPNASLEVQNPVTRLPDCFSNGGWGANHLSSRVVSPGRTGRSAFQVAATDVRSGDAKIVPTQDMGTCSATVTPGRRYTARVAYRSTAPTTLVVFVRDAYGRWDSWRTSVPVPASDTWRTASFTTPPVPSGRTGMAFGLALASNGTVTTDDYSLVRAGSTPLPSAPYTPAPMSAAAPGGGGNLVRNPSLEQMSADSGLPTCFQADGQGDASRIWSRAPAGGSGPSAMQLTVSDSSGEGRSTLLPEMSSACAPAVAAGVRLAATVDYRADAPVSLVVLREDENGHWSEWQRSPAAPTRQGWGVARFTTPPVPAGTRAVTFGPSMTGNGTMAVDDFTLVQLGD